MSDRKQSDVKQPGWLCKVWLWVKRWWLPIAILLITSIGLACALSIPQQVFETPREPANDKSAPVLLAQSNLRLAFLYITGGAIAVVGLIETFRKNNNEKLKNDQDKEKNDREHLRQVRADRRERYTKAVEQLGDEKAPIRMGGVYTLVGLVDEWLEEESIRKYEDRLKEGQVIINNLCAYIRSPFTLASHYDELSNPTPTPKGIYKDKKEEFYVDKATLDSETDVRLSIIKEIHDRIQGPDKNTPGAWSDFEYDFSGSTFFYPVDLTKSYYKKPVNFSGATYEGWANFSHSTYEGEADFNYSTYEGWANFNYSTYKGEADFNYSTYKGWANFTDSTYKGEANFTDSTYKGWANFTDSTYEGGAYFNYSTYKGWANFSRSTYKGEADFSGSVFYREIYFGYSTYSPSFSRFTNYAPQFYDETNRKNTLFGSPDNDFTAENGRGYPIYRGLEGLPLNCNFLTTEQKEYLADKFQEIEKINNELLEIKDDKEKARLSDTLRSLNEELHEWREEATTVKVEDGAIENAES